jgi:hypothetical protein
MSSASIAGGIVHADGTGQFLGVDWGAFVIVFVVSIIAAGVIVCFYSIAVRLLAIGSADDENADTRVAPQSPEQVAAARAARPTVATVGAYLCFAVCGAAVIFGILMVIPAHDLPSWLWFGRTPS